MSPSANRDARGAWCAPVRGVSRLSNADWAFIREERSRARPTPWRVLAERFAVTEADLRAALATPDPAPPANDDKPPATFGINLAMFAAEWESSANLRTVAARFKIGDIRAREIAQIMGLTPRKGTKGRWKGQDYARLRQMMADGHTSPEIGRTMGFSAETIREKAHEIGLYFPRRGRAR
jgi:hypothetical protein